MKAVILCGENGTRIRDISEVLPELEAPFSGKPLCCYILKLYNSERISEFILD